MSQASTSQTHSDVLIIGAGIAGGVAACALHQMDGDLRGNLKVTVVERSAWPREKVCGCCLNARAIDALRRAGLGPVLKRLSTQSEHAPARLRLSVGQYRADLPLPMTLAIDRRRLDEAIMQEAVRRGAAFIPHARAAVCPPEPETGNRLRQVDVKVADGTTRRHTARWVIAADGLAGSSLKRLSGFGGVTRPAARIGLGLTLPIDTADRVGLDAGVIDMYVSDQKPGGYVGVVGLQDGRLGVAAALDPVMVQQHGGPQAALVEILRSCRGRATQRQILMERLGDPKTPVSIKGTPPLTRRRDKLAEPGLLVAGDAAGYVEPFTGEGMAWAATSGLQAAALIKDAIAHDLGPHQAATWPVQVRRLVRHRQRVCRIAAFVLRHSVLAKAGCCLAGRVASVPQAVLRRMAEPARIQCPIAPPAQVPPVTQASSPTQAPLAKHAAT